MVWGHEAFFGYNRAPPEAKPGGSPNIAVPERHLHDGLWRGTAQNIRARLVDAFSKRRSRAPATGGSNGGIEGLPDPRSRPCPVLARWPGGPRRRRGARDIAEFRTGSGPWPWKTPAASPRLWRARMIWTPHCSASSPTAAQGRNESWRKGASAVRYKAPRSALQRWVRDLVVPVMLKRFVTPRVQWNGSTGIACRMASDIGQCQPIAWLIPGRSPRCRDLRRGDSLEGVRDQGQFVFVVAVVYLRQPAHQRSEDAMPKGAEPLLVGDDLEWRRPSLGAALAFDPSGVLKPVQDVRHGRGLQPQPSDRSSWAGGSSVLCCAIIPSAFQSVGPMPKTSAALPMEKARSHRSSRVRRARAAQSASSLLVERLFRG